MSTNYYQHDTTWLELARALDKADHALDSGASWLLYAADWSPRDRGNWSWRHRGTGIQLRRPEALKSARETLLGKTERMLSYRQTGPEMVAEFDAKLAARAEALAALTAHDKLYTGWQRYFLVVSSPGLIHSSTRCSTCNKGVKNTLFALLPTLSGRNYADAVDVLGPSLCSVCFPDAATAIVDGPKIPARVAEILFASGPEKFVEALAAHNIKQAAKAAKKGS